MASVLLRPSVVSFVDIATRSPDLKLRMEQTSVNEHSSIAGMTLGEAKIPQQTGLIVIAIGKHSAAGMDFVFNPSATTRIEAGDDVIVLGDSAQIERLKRYVG
jgi:voltage-gated potassium channel